MKLTYTLGKNMQSLSINSVKHAAAIVAVSAMSLTGCGGSDNNNPPQLPDNNQPTVQVQVGKDNNSKSNALLLLNPAGPGGSSNQSFRGGDVLVGSAGEDVLIGGLGVDILIGDAGNDILIGGTEDFNSSVDGDGAGSDNRDRAFGQDGDDTFIWAPGDGSDFFDGGDGTDVIIFGVLGEAADTDGNTAGAPFFAVNLPGNPGSQDFDGIFLNASSQPTVRASNSPGFCTVVDAIANAASLAQLNIDHIIRFSIRGIANAFDAATRTDDDGLRVAVSVKNVEFLVCTRRAFDANDGIANVEVFDISGATPIAAEIADLPSHVQALIQ